LPPEAFCGQKYTEIDFGGIVTPQTNGWHTIYAPTGDRLLWILRGPRGRVKNAHVESGLWTVVKSRGRAIVRSYIGECSWQTGSGEILESTPVSRLPTNSSCGWLRLVERCMTHQPLCHIWFKSFRLKLPTKCLKYDDWRTKRAKSAMSARVDSPLTAPDLIFSSNAINIRHLTSLSSQYAVYCWPTTEREIVMWPQITVTSLHHV